MPSLPDQTSATERAAAPGDVLTRVKAEGLRRRRRRQRRNAALAAVALVAVAVPVATLLPGGDSEESVRVATSPDGSSSGGEALRGSTDGSTDGSADGSADERDAPATSTPTTVTVTVPVTAGEADPDERSVSSPPTTAAEEPPATAPATTTPPPPPPNQPLTASIDGPTHARVGEEVSYRVTWSDPDAKLAYEEFSVDGTLLARPCSYERGAPEEPAVPAAGNGVLVYEHTFTAPGEHLVAVALSTGSCASRYGDDTSVELVVTVEPAA